MVPSLRRSAAQTAGVDERTQHTRAGEPFEVGAGLGQAQTAATDVADRDVAADEGVDVDAAGEDVAARAGEVQRSVAGGEVLDHLGGDEGQLEPGPVGAAGAERAGAVGVAVARQAAAGECAGPLDQPDGRAGQRCHREQLHDPGQPCAEVGGGEHGVQGRHGVGAGDVEVRGGATEQRRVLRAEDHPGRRPEREDGDLAPGAVGEGAGAAVDDGDPPAGPLERPRVVDRDEPRAAAGQPAPAGAERVRERQVDELGELVERPAR
jgi:hypothetical protein